MNASDAAGRCDIAHLVAGLRRRSAEEVRYVHRVELAPALEAQLKQLRRRLRRVQLCRQQGEGSIYYT